jgi:hypothetical protein
MSSLPAAGYLTNAARTEGEVKTALDDWLAATKQLPGGAAISTLTLATDAATPTGAVHRIDTEAAAATDNMANLAVTNLPAGSLLLVTNANASRLVVAKHAAGGSGQLSLKTGGDFVLANPDKDWLLLVLISTTWTEILRSPDTGVSDVLTKTGAYTTTAADRNKLIDGTSGTWTLTLLAAATAGKDFVQPIKNSGTGVITLDGNGAETIDGSTTLALNQGDEIVLVCDGSNWKSFSRYVASGTDFPDMLRNLKLAASVAGNALTVSVKNSAGNDPSAGDPVKLSFRSATLTDGGYAVRSITGALSVVLSSGSTMGFPASWTDWIHAWAIDNAGTVELALSRYRYGFNEFGVVSTTAEGGAGAADSATVMYSTTARANVACRYLGKIKIQTGATPGQWGSAPTVTHTASQDAYLEGGIWTDVTGSRALGTAYQNTSGRKRRVLAVCYGPAPGAINVEFFAGTVNPPTTSLATGTGESDAAGSARHRVVFSVEIPDGWYYQITNNSGGTLGTWFELDE